MKEIIRNEKSPMTMNSSGEFDFSKLKKVPSDSIEAKLYQLLDDIDTATDMFKPEMNGFEKYTIKRIKEAHKLIISDGYDLYYVAGEKTI